MLVVKKQTSFLTSGRLLRIRDGRFCLVDESNYEFLMNFTWFALKSAASEYIVARKTKGGITRTIRMHRLITKCPPSMKVHHLNNNTFDNRKENLKVITEFEHRKFDGWRIFYR